MILLNSYMMVDFDSPADKVRSIKRFVGRDDDVLRASALRKEVEAFRPCEKAPCDWGEMTEENKARLLENVRECIRKL